jgi:glycerol-3-phosphate acyltransferase PlsX
LSGIKLALDVMGGDLGPHIAVPAISRALNVYADLNLIVFGNKEEVLPILRELNLDDDARVEFRHTDNFVKDDDDPIHVLRHGKDTSMYKAILSVKEKETQGIISAGNTGALVALSNHLIGNLESVHRSALVQILPSFTSKGTVFLDLGANIRVTPEILHQYGVMGAVLSKTVLGISAPRVGILNIGVEPNKGTELVVNSAQLLKQDKHINYIGFVEGNDLFTGKADVIVTDAFTGNVALKTAEGLYRVLESRLQGSKSKISSLILQPIKRFVKKRVGLMQPDVYNGSVLLGLDGVVIKSHGSASSQAYASAIAQAYEEVKLHLPKRIADGLTQIQGS